MQKEENVNHSPKFAIFLAKMKEGFLNFSKSYYLQFWSAVSSLTVGDNIQENRVVCKIFAPEWDKILSRRMGKSKKGANILLEQSISNLEACIQAVHQNVGTIKLLMLLKFFNFLLRYWEEDNLYNKR